MRSSHFQGSPVIVYSLYIDIDIEEDKSDLISAIWFVHNLSVVDNTRFDTVDQVDDGEGGLDGGLVLEVLDRVGLLTLGLLVKSHVDQSYSKNWLVCLLIGD